MSIKKISRREMLKGLGLAAVGTTLAACTPQVVKETVVVEKIVEKPVEKIVKETVIVQGTPQVVEKVITVAPAPPEPITISMWHGWTGADNTEMLDEIIGKYNETNEDGITLEPTAYGWDEFFAKWVMATAAGNPADVALYHPTETPEFVQRGTVIEMDAFAEMVDWSWEGIAEPVKEQCFYQGKLYSIIEDIHPIAMYYNADLVEAAGLDPDSPPTDQEGFLEWVQAMTKKDSDGNFVQVGGGMPTTGIARWIWHSFLYQNGGQFLDDANKPAFNSPEGAEALQFMHDLLHKYEIAPVGHNDWEDFRSGMSGLEFNGPWNVNAFLGAGLNLRTAPLPSCFKQPAAWCNSHCLSLSKTDDLARQIAGMKFIKWFAQNNIEACVKVGVIPTDPKVMEELQAHEWWVYYKAFADEADYVAYEPAVPQYSQIFSFGKPTPLTVNVEAALTNEKTIQQALDDMEQGIADILATPIT